MQVAFSQSTLRQGQLGLNGSVHMLPACSNCCICPAMPRIAALLLRFSSLPAIRFGSFSNGFKTGTSDLDVVFVGAVDESAISILQTPGMQGIPCPPKILLSDLIRF